MEETYDSGDYSNQIPIIPIAEKLQKEHALVYNKQQPKSLLAFRINGVTTQTALIPCFV